MTNAILVEPHHIKKGPVTPKFKSSHLLNSSTSFAGAISPVTPKFKSSHLLNSSTSFTGAIRHQ
jgi:hypothetical protein